MSMNRWAAATAFLAVLLSFIEVRLATAANAEVLKAVKDRGAINCGVSEGLYGFSARDKDGNWSGFDVDLCRAIAAAIFNDASKVNYTPLESQPPIRGASIRQYRRPLAQYHVDDVARDRAWTELYSHELLRRPGVSRSQGHEQGDRARPRRREGVRADRNNDRAQSRRLFPRQQNEIRSDWLRSAEGCN